jgi:anti-sigma factor RsiW
MTCEECEQFLLDSRHHTNGDGWMLRASRAALIQTHIENCPACATKMTETTKLDDALDQLRVATKQFQVSPEIEKNLLAAFRQEAARRRRSFDSVFAWRLAWLCTATLVLVAVGMFLYSRLWLSHPLTHEGSRPGNEARIEAPAAPGFSGAAAEALDPYNHATAEHGNRGSTHRLRKVSRATHESVSGRVAIPGEDLSMNGGGNIVRVTLPFSSLVAMGVPVRPDISDSRVTADVWMDPFGAVVGIRLVEPKASAD